MVAKLLSDYYSWNVERKEGHVMTKRRSVQTIVLNKTTSMAHLILKKFRLGHVRRSTFTMVVVKCSFVGYGCSKSGSRKISYGAVHTGTRRW